MNRVKSTLQRGTRFLLTGVFLFSWIAGFASTASAAGSHQWTQNAVFTMTNSASGNEIVVLQRSKGGGVSQTVYATGGLGSGAGLGSQGALILSEHDLLLFAVNAGSNELSVFAVLPKRLVLLDVVDSGGEHPISVTKHGRLVYVLNAGGSGNITGFKIGKFGKLSPVEGSTQPLSNGGTGASPQPAQISFSPDGKWLVVTEKMTNLIDVYAVANGVAAPPTSHPSAGMTPFGFAFDPSGHLIVSEAFGGAPGASTMSSYHVGHDFEVISPAVATTQTAACWVVISKDGKYAYDTNTGSGSISSFTIGTDGSLTLLDPQAGLTGEGSSPIDMDITSDGKFLVALGGNGTITGFEVKADGSLVLIGQVNVPMGSVGLAAR